MNPLRYPAMVTSSALVVCAVVAALAISGERGPDQASAILVVMLVIAIGGGVRLLTALVRRTEPAREVTVRRVRQQHQLTSRSWLEITDGTETDWLPVYFDPQLVTMPTPASAQRSGNSVTYAGTRLFPSGRARTTEPRGRLVDNPTRPDPDGVSRAAAANRSPRRLILDAQFAIGAPLVGMLWVFVDGGGWPAFVGATIVAAAAAVWYPAITGSDPS